MPNNKILKKVFPSILLSMSLLITSFQTCPLINASELAETTVPASSESDDTTTQTINYSPLKLIVQNIQSHLDDPDYCCRFTDATLCELKTAVTQATEMISDQSATSYLDINGMITHLKTALSNLVIKVSERPNLTITDNEVKILLNNSYVKIQKYVEGVAADSQQFAELFSQSNLEKGCPCENSVTLDRSGIYTFYVTDQFEYGFYLTIRFYYYENTNSDTDTDDKSSSTSEYIDTSLLNYELKVAENLYDTTPICPSGLCVGTNYTDEASKQTFESSITEAESSLKSIASQESINSAYSNLVESESAFKDSLNTVTWEFITVDGSTITVHPNDGCSIYKVSYNTKSDGSLATGIWKDWTSFNFEKNQKSKYSDFIWENVPDGIYTFAITETDSTGARKTYYELITVNTSSDSVTLAKDFLKHLVTLVEPSLDIKKKSEAMTGDTYTTDRKYNNVVNEITASNTLLSDTNAEFDSIVTQCYKLYASMLSMQKHTYIMEESDTTSAEITEENGTITISKKELQEVFIARGQFASIDDMKEAGCSSYWPSGTSYSTTVDYNDYYTLYIKYADDTNELRTIQVTDIPDPFTITETNGNIHIENTGKEVIKTGLCPGENNDATCANYMMYNCFEQDLTAPGNCGYTVYLKDCNGEEYFEPINVCSCTEPAITTSSDEVYVGTFGFEISIVAYKKGHFDTWDEMVQNSTSIDQCCTYDKDNFVPGEYTFYFKSETNIEYFVYVTM